MKSSETRAMYWSLFTALLVACGIANVVLLAAFTHVQKPVAFAIGACFLMASGFTFSKARQQYDSSLNLAS